MKFNSIIFLITFSLLIIIPIANAQIIGDKANQKSIEVEINSSGEVHVTHVISKSNLPQQMELINGTVTNLTVKDLEGNEKQFALTGEDDALLFFPSKEELKVEYDLADKLVLKDNVWIWDFLYLESTSFIFPDQVEFVFVNDRPAYLGEKKGIKCHGCQMILEFSLNEPTLIEELKIQEKKYLIEIKTLAKVNNFSFIPALNGIGFEIIGENNFVTVIIPVDLMDKPYQVFFDKKKMLFHEFNNNGTHVWLNVRPQNSGEVLFTGNIIPDSSNFESSDNPVPFEYVVVGITILGLVIFGLFLYKRKKS